MIEIDVPDRRLAMPSGFLMLPGVKSLMNLRSVPNNFNPLKKLKDPCGLYFCKYLFGFD
jgi:hypothetical protein